MLKISVPASSANLGIGFDCVGVALDLYNTFTVKRSEEWLLHGFSGTDSLENNLFIHSYDRTAEYLKLEKQACEVTLKADIPISRGLGSSATLIIAGICACSYLNGFALSEKEMLKLAVSIEGHPDNVTPALVGGLCICKDDTYSRKLISDRYHFGLWIPDQALSTQAARKVLPDSYDRQDAVNNIAAALLGIDALINGEDENIHFLMQDRIHEPYRQKLIPDFEIIKNYALENGALAFLISGSGSACLSIQKQDFSKPALPATRAKWIYKNVQICHKGTTVCQENT